MTGVQRLLIVTCGLVSFHAVIARGAVLTSLKFQASSPCTPPDPNCVLSPVDVVHSNILPGDFVTSEHLHAELALGFPVAAEIANQTMGLLPPISPITPEDATKSFMTDAVNFPTLPG